MAAEEARPETARPEHVIFVCVQEGSRLRVRLDPESAATHRLSPHANAQFPRNVRTPGGRYQVPRDRVGFGQGPGGKYFFRVAANAVSVIVEPAALAGLVVFGDEADNSCCICMSSASALVFAPCGHYCTCGDCGRNPGLRNCPLCRAAISQRVAREQLG